MKRLYKKILVGFSVAVVTLQFSCAPTPEPKLQIGQAYAINGIKYQPKIQPNYKEVGYASWYGSRFHKRKTANGDVFDKYQFTAAHKTLPLPSIVKVTNLTNGKTLNVLVNDRGPFVRGRIIDLSEAAAGQLGFRGKGIAKVLVELDKEASLALLKDPNLKVGEAVKKRIATAYLDGNMPDFQKSQESQEAGYQVAVQNTRAISAISPAAGGNASAKFARVIPAVKPIIPASMQNIQVISKPVYDALPQSASIQIAQKPVYIAPQQNNGYAIQVASTTSETDAYRITSKLKNLSSKIQKANVNGKTYYRVHVSVSGQENVQYALNTIKSEGFKDAFVLKESR